jgi:predicted RNA binding protein YcfA (HicA-like mRNA interferase family)
VSKTLRHTSGGEVVKVLCNHFGFEISGKSGSHIRLSKITASGKVGTVVPLHPELKIGTLKGILKLAKIDPEDFAYFL